MATLVFCRDLVTVFIMLLTRILTALKVTDWLAANVSVHPRFKVISAAITAALQQVLRTLPGPAETSPLHCQDATSGPEGAVMMQASVSSLEPAVNVPYLTHHRLKLFLPDANTSCDHLTGKF